MSKLDVNYKDKWIIKYNGKELFLPDEIKHNNMNTFKLYGCKYDGISCNHWTCVNMYWILPMFECIGVSITQDLLLELYKQINELDWR